MKINGTNFGRVHGASGVQGFFGEGYSYHRWLSWLGLDFSGMTFVAKTTTLDQRRGNMALGADYKPIKFVPDCIVVKPFKGVALNAVGLSGPGVKALLQNRRWQARSRPFMLSFMSVQAEEKERRDELKAFVDILGPELCNFSTQVGLQLNWSCPNVGLNSTHLLKEVGKGHEIASALKIPLIAKLSVEVSPQNGANIAQEEHVHGICVSNTVRWGTLAQTIDWNALFGSNISPLADYGGGGLSGAPLFPIVRNWLIRFREIEPHFPICAGGGILRPSQAVKLLHEGADAIFIGSMAFLRPWNVRRTIKIVNAFTRS